MVGFDQAEYNGFERIIGAKLCKKRAKRNKNFRYIGHTIQDFTNQTVKLAFNVLCGVMSIAEAKDLLPPDIAASCNEQTNVHRSQSAPWVKWLSRERILKLFCEAYTLRDNEK